MADNLTAMERSNLMRLIRSKDTKPELFVRKLLFNLGYRYRLHQKELPGCPDIVFRSRKKIIFIHGCFWHRHLNCRSTRFPKSKLEYWKPKLLRNQRRDEHIKRELKTLGWKLLVVWECQKTKPKRLTARLKRFLGENSSVKNLRT